MNAADTRARCTSPTEFYENASSLWRGVMRDVLSQEARNFDKRVSNAWIVAVVSAIMTVHALTLPCSKIVCCCSTSPSHHMLWWSFATISCEILRSECTRLSSNLHSLWKFSLHKQNCASTTRNCLTASLKSWMCSYVTR